jgi:hypothetical protein
MPAERVAAEVTGPARVPDQAVKARKQGEKAPVSFSEVVWIERQTSSALKRWAEAWLQ